LDEQQKKAILERRTANRKLAELIQQGMRHHEPLKLKLVDGKEHDVEVYPFSEEEFRTLLEEFKEVNLKDLADQDKMSENLKFIEKVARLATGQENITDLVLASGCSEIMLKCFEISGLSASKGKDVESFQSRDLQS
jgi:hypothetical protein